MALGAIVVVAVSILAATTLLPVLMRLFGRRVYQRGRIALTAGVWLQNLRNIPRRRGSTRPGAARPDFWTRWTDRVMRRPWLAAGASAGVLLVLAIPALSLTFGDGALRQFPKTDDTRVGAELAAKKLGAGAAAPTQVLAEFDRGTAASPDNRSALNGYVRELRRDPEVAEVGRPQPSRDGQRGADHRHASPRRRERAGAGAVERLRRRRLGSRASRTSRSAGRPPSVEDFKNLVSGSMWKILLFVLAFSYLVLFVLLRSVLLPLKAVLMNLLSVAAAYGVLVAIFQWGWIDGFLGFESLGYINTMTPPLLLAIVFGLSMDYEVFLLSRIRERYDATGDTATAVAQGLRQSAVTITSAALIMVAVFAVFAGTGVPSIKEIGVGLSVAIALDATLVRLVLVPATMQIMGRWNWWLPRPLARVLPRASFEASGAGAPERAPA